MLFVEEKGYISSPTTFTRQSLEKLIRRTQVSFDALGDQLSKELVMRKCSPAAREDKLSFFKETTPKRMSSYRPDQVAAILRQRKNVRAAIEEGSSDPLLTWHNRLMQLSGYSDFTTTAPKSPTVTVP